ARVGLFDKPDDLLGAESALLHVRPLGFTDFIASAGTAQWGQVTLCQGDRRRCHDLRPYRRRLRAHHHLAA
ncbi:hypothetical protein QYG81_15530, partial [Xanthomonas euvesicatoria]|uniref:hypothetical protein n=1 Tax=Xanthomonas euvesicatoria TaxID=456327 RepID=UPI0032B42AB4